MSGRRKIRFLEHRAGTARIILGLVRHFFRYNNLVVYERYWGKCLSERRIGSRGGASAS